MASLAEIVAMRQAIALSAFGLGTTSPNPPVGCVILDADGRLVGEGFHERKGEPHAEGHALRRAGERARGGTAVVTLEPCNHAGRTPACRRLLLDAGIVRVVIAVLDPTSRGDGGAQVLRDHGVSVEVGVLAAEAELVLGPWLTSLRAGRPHVTWACRLTADGLVAPHARFVEQLRRQTDAVVLPDGPVEEGVPGGHGRGTVQVPTAAPADQLLKALDDGGCRSLLLAGPSPEPVLATDAVDRVVIDIDYPDQAAAPLDVARLDELGLSPGHALVGVRKHRDGLRLELRRPVP